MGLAWNQTPREIGCRRDRGACVGPPLRELRCAIVAALLLSLLACRGSSSKRVACACVVCCRAAPTSLAAMASLRTSRREQDSGAPISHP